MANNRRGFARFSAAAEQSADARADATAAEKVAADRSLIRLNKTIAEDLKR